MDNYLATTSAQHQSELYELMDELLQAKLPQAVSNNMVFVNEIPSKLDLKTDQQLVADVLDGMLSSVARHTRETCVRLSAKVYGDVVLVHIRKQGDLDITAFEKEVGRLHTMAERILGSVSLNTERKDIATLTFGFPNLPLLQ